MLLFCKIFIKDTPPTFAGEPILRCAQNDIKKRESQFLETLSKKWR